MSSKNLTLIKKYRDDWYRKNKNKQIKRQIERRQELRNWLNKYKETLNCNICGCSFKNKPEWCDFHHLDKKEKDGKITLLINSGKEKVLKEIKKCIPLCANCHRTVHFGKGRL